MADVKMQASRFSTVTVPAIGTSASQLNIPMIFKAASRPMRILIRNIGPTPLFLAYTANELEVVPAVSGVFELPPATSEAFVLAPEQGIYAASQGAGGLLCYAASDAIPLSWES